MTFLPFFLISGLAFAQETPASTEPAVVPVAAPVAETAPVAAPVEAIAVPTPDPSVAARASLEAAASAYEKSASRAKQAVDATKDATKLRGQEVGLARTEVTTAKLKLKAAQQLLKARRVAGQVPANAPERNDLTAAETNYTRAKHDLKVATLAFAVSKADLSHAKAFLGQEEARRDEAQALASLPLPSEKDLIKLASARSKAEGREATAAGKLADLVSRLTTLQNH